MTMSLYMRSYVKLCYVMFFTYYVVTIHVLSYYVFQLTKNAPNEL